MVNASPGNTIDGNLTHDNEDSGIGLWKGANNCVAFNNVSYSNGDHGIDVLQATGENVVSNSVYRNVDSGIELQGGAGANLANNIAVDNGINSPRTSGNLRVVDTTSASQSTLDYDLVYLSSGNDLIDWLGVKYSSLSAFQAATGREPHATQADPKWTNPTSGDLHLLAGSPAIDSANSGAVGESATDADGRARVNDPLAPNTGVGPRSYDDRGAFEYQPINHPPVATADAATTTPNTPVTVNVLANDSDPDNDPLTLTGTSVPAHGIGVLNPDNTVAYTPAPGYLGPDAFTYTISDGNGGTASATVSIAVNPPPNLITNPGFEVDTSGWQAGSSATTLSRMAGGHSGNWAAQLSNSSAGAQCTLDDKPNTVGLTQAGPYTASVWVRSDTAGLTFKLRIREYQGGTQVGLASTTVTLSSSWQQVTVVHTPVAPGQSILDFQGFTVNSPVGTCFRADDASITHWSESAEARAHERHGVRHLVYPEHVLMASLWSDLRSPGQHPAHTARAMRRLKASRASMPE